MPSVAHASYRSQHKWLKMLRPRRNVITVEGFIGIFKIANARAMRHNLQKYRTRDIAETKIILIFAIQLVLGPGG